MEVADLSQMRVVVRLEESDIGVIASGQNAVVRIHAYPDEVFKGTVESVALTRTSLQRERSTSKRGYFSIMLREQSMPALARTLT